MSEPFTPASQQISMLRSEQIQLLTAAFNELANEERRHYEGLLLLIGTTTDLLCKKLDALQAKKLLKDFRKHAKKQKRGR